MSNYDYKCFIVEQEGAVATIRLLPAPYTGGNLNWELGELFSRMRGDNSIRVIVITGSDENFNVPGEMHHYHDPKWQSRYEDPARLWHTFTGIIRCHQGMAEIEKPIIAKVNGDAIGFGSSLVFSCDFIIAREDAVIMDNHMGGTVMASYGGVRKPGGHEFSNIPGDGGTALLPLFMSPCKAKEYLMLAESHTAAELAELGAINYAVPAAELDAKVDHVVQRLLQRGAYALARTKRLVNRPVVQQLNAVLDAAAGYEMVGLLQPLYIDKLG